jgi:hypothetical protein
MVSFNCEVGIIYREGDFVNLRNACDKQYYESITSHVAEGCTHKTIGVYVQSKPKASANSCDSSTNWVSPNILMQKRSRETQISNINIRKLQPNPRVPNLFNAHLGLCEG